MFPNAPNWQSGEPGAGWFRTEVPGTGTRVCAIQGRSMIRRAQRRLNSVLRRAVGGGLVDGSPFLSVDGSMGPLTLQALALRADRLNEATPGQGFATLRDTIRQDVTGRRISDTTFRFALWVAYLEGTANEWQSVLIPRGSTLPRFASAPDEDFAFDADHGDGGAWCWTEGAEEPPTLPTRQQVQTAAGTDAGRTTSGTQTARNANGTRTPSEIAATNGNQQSSGLGQWWSAASTGEKAAVGAAGLALVFVGWQLLGAGKRRRRRK
jgi:hypothetical protein